ncbi:MAG: TIGR01777 family oxidoreductase [Verrucomicrobiota bacterium]
MSSKRKYILAGGSGFLGQELAKALVERGDEVVVLTRFPDKYRGQGRAVYWDGETADREWVREVDGATAVVNLAGKNVNCAPTKANRREIVESRVNSVKALGDAFRLAQNPPKTWIQTSSLAIYGDAGDKLCDELAMPAEAFPADVCVAWEEALGHGVLSNTRWAALRIGFVLGKGGALPFLTKLVKWGLGGSIGNGRQWISWLHIDDMIALFLAALDDESYHGVYNATNDSPVTNKELMATLRRVLKRPWSPPSPALAVTLGAPVLGSDPRVALTGRRCVSRRLAEHYFTFKYPNLDVALQTLL